MSDEIQDLDKKTLEEFYNRLLKTTTEYKYLQFTFLWKFLHSNPTFFQLCNTINNDAGNRFDFHADQIVGQKVKVFFSEEVHDRLLLSYKVLELINKMQQSNILHRIGEVYYQDNRRTSDDLFDLFNDLFLEPFIFSLLNNATKNTVILSHLKKYKQKAEWFDQDQLSTYIKTDSKKLEHKLKANLYSYLFDKGFNFHIEPSSPSGELDFLAAQKGSSNKFLIEGKIFDGNRRSKKNIIDGYFQLLPYLNDFNETKGYLVIYNTCEKIINFVLDLSPDGFAFITTANKTIYFIVVNVCFTQPSASKRGKLPLIDITRSDFI